MVKLSLLLKEDQIQRQLFLIYPLSWPKLKRISRLFQWRMLDKNFRDHLQAWSLQVLQHDIGYFERKDDHGNVDIIVTYQHLVYDGYMEALLPRYGLNSRNNADERQGQGQRAPWQIDDIWTFFNWLQKWGGSTTYDQLVAVMFKERYTSEYTLIQKAVSHQHLPVVSYLLELATTDRKQEGQKGQKGLSPGQSKSINDKGAFGYTALHEACYLGDVLIVRALLEARANVDALSRNGSTAILVAAREGHSKVVQELIMTGGADPEDGGDKGSSPLALAAQTVSPAHVDVCRVLLHHKANVDGLADDLGWSYGQQIPLTSAAAVGNDKVVSLLLQCKADVWGGAEHDGSDTPIKVASSKKQTKTAQILQSWIDNSSV